MIPTRATKTLVEEIVRKPILVNPDKLVAPGAVAVYTTGSGKAGGGGGAEEHANTMRSEAVVRIVEVVADGPNEGIAGGAQGIYVNDTPVQNADETFNFGLFASKIDITRVGAAGETYLPGFPAVESEQAGPGEVSILVNNKTAITTDTTNTVIDRVKVTILLPEGLSIQDKKTGDLKPHFVKFAIDRRIQGGAWSAVGEYEIKGKTMAPYEAQYEVTRPAGTGVWEVRVRRITPDGTSEIRNKTSFNRFTQIQDIKVTYTGAHVVGIEMDAAAVGNQIPKRGYLVKGRLIQVPSNYNPVTRVYSGAWNGQFKNVSTASSNGAYVLYDVLTSTKYGAGIDPSSIDKFSFYDAGVYNDQAVAYTVGGDISANNHPRFTFNVRIADLPPMYELCKNIAGSFNANLVYWNGKWTLIQDRPSNPTKIVTKANVIDGAFRYKSSPLVERHTAFNVTFNDTNDRYLQRTAVVEDESFGAMDRYGYNGVDIPAYGCTNEAQAKRVARHALYTEINQTELVEFSMHINGFDLMPGEVISVADEDTNNKVMAGRIVAVGGPNAGGRQITLDRPVQLAVGSKLFVQLANGRTMGRIDGAGALVGFDIVQTAGSLSVINVSASTPLPTTQSTSDTTTAVFEPPVLEGADFIVSTPDVNPRSFRIIDIKRPETTAVQVTAIEYLPGKYSWVETGVDIPAPPFFNVVRTVVNAPGGPIRWFPESAVLPTGGIKRTLGFSWDPPANQTVAGYDITWSYTFGPRTTFPADNNFASIPADDNGTYFVSIYSRDYGGNKSGSALEGEYTYTSGGATDNPTGFGGVTNIRAKDTNTLLFNTRDLIVIWDDAPGNSIPAVGYRVEILTGPGGTVVSTTNVTAREFPYPLSLNIAENGGTVPRNPITVRISAKDPFGKFSLGAVATLTNPAPAAVQGLQGGGMNLGAIVRWAPNAEPDVEGYHIWRGTTANFVASSSNYRGSTQGTTYTEVDLLASSRYYYRVAAYDVYNQRRDGVGLNTGSSIAVDTLVDIANNFNEYRSSGFIFQPNAGGNNRVTWTAGTVRKTLGVGAGTTSWNVAAGSATWTTGILFIYWNEDTPGILQTSTSALQAVSAKGFTLGTYRGDKALEVSDGRAFTDGGLIIPQTVTAGALVADQAVLKTSIQIGNSIITLDHFDINTINAKGGIRGAHYTAGAFSGPFWPTIPLTVAEQGVNVTYQPSYGGFYLGPEGLLMGYYNNGAGQHLHITSTGNVYSREFRIENGNAFFAGTLQAADGVFSGQVKAGSFATGDFTGFGWPATTGPNGGFGSYLDGSGLLLGNPARGAYFQVNRDGSVASPFFSIAQNGTTTLNRLIVGNEINASGLVISNANGDPLANIGTGINGASWIKDLSVGLLKIGTHAVSVNLASSGATQEIAVAYSVPAGETWKMVVTGTQNFFQDFQIIGAGGAFSTPEVYRMDLYVGAGNPTPIGGSSLNVQNFAGAVMYATIDEGGASGSPRQSWSVPGFAGCTSTMVIDCTGPQSFQLNLRTMSAAGQYNTHRARNAFKTISAVVTKRRTGQPG